MGQTNVRHVPHRVIGDILLMSRTDGPNEDPNIRGDAFKTLIVARLSYEADERDLEREFGRFGPIERVRQPTIFCENIFQS
jgi:RNA recognition motif-containing protein